MKEICKTMKSEKPRTAEEYVGMVDQALFEIRELRTGLEFDMEEESVGMGFLEPLENALGKLRQSMADGSYHFANEDLPFMLLVNRFRSRIPCAKLLGIINETHRTGLNVDES